MSLIPYLLESELFPRRGRLLDQHFGLDLTPDDILSSVAAPLALVTSDYYRPWRQLAAVANDLGSTVTGDKDKVQLKLDVQQFAPEEISVKTADGYVVIEGKHEEKQDEQGFVSRQFTRRYALPADCAPEKVESRLSSDGVLTIVAPRNTAPAVTNERNVAIQQAGPARKQIKHDAKKNKKGEKMQE